MNKHLERLWTYPVMATILLRSCRACTILTLLSGLHRAITSGKLSACSFVSCRSPCQYALERILT